MAAALAIILSSILDIPTLITAIGSIWARSKRKIFLIAIIAVIIGEIIAAFTKPTYHFLDIFYYRLIGQLIVAYCIIGIRKIKNKKLRISITLALILLLLSCFTFLISLKPEPEQNKFTAPKKDISIKQNKPLLQEAQMPAKQLDEKMAQIKLDTHKEVTGSILPSAKSLMEAAERGNPESQNIIAVHYKYGTGGLPQDYSLAYMWFNLSALQGNKTGEEYREKLLPLMTSQQVEQGKAHTKEWLERKNNKAL